EKTHCSSGEDQRKREGQPPGLEFRDIVGNYTPGRFFERGRAGKKRSSVSIISEPEQNQVMLVDRFTTLRPQGVKLCLIFIGSIRRCDFPAHSQNRRSGNAGRFQERLVR